ncbi:MAG: nucleotide sugar dehydrogenase [Solirubrobacteraceae bacterium]
MICVLGMWHLGTVTAACLAEVGFTVTGVDPDPAVIADLANGRPPIFEPGLEQLVAAQIAAGRLRFPADPQEALRQAEVVWVAFDTPVDDDDQADTAFVIDATLKLLEHVREATLVVVSAQLPVGSVFALATHRPDLAFACVPENLRLGGALDAFREPDRIVAGVRSDEDRERLAPLLGPFSEHVEWMGVESSEMTKHALNSFLATSVAFINEVSTICEAVGADAAEVSRGLMSERRVGPGAYLRAGDAFAGGTLARDVTFLRERAAAAALPSHLLSGVANSNDAHKQWSRRVIAELLPGDLARRRVAVWGLTYKPGTSTLRRSSAIALCEWLVEQGVHVRAHDPAVKELPQNLAARVELCGDAETAAAGADALVVCTPWPEYRSVAAATSIVIDAAGFLKATLGANPAVRYVQVGSSS